MKGSARSLLVASVSRVGWRPRGRELENVGVGKVNANNTKKSRLLASGDDSALRVAFRCRLADVPPPRSNFLSVQ